MKHRIKEAREKPFNPVELGLTLNLDNDGEEYFTAIRGIASYTLQEHYGTWNLSQTVELSPGGLDNHDNTLFQDLKIPSHDFGYQLLKAAGVIE